MKCFWNEGSPRRVKEGSTDKLTGRTIGSRPDPAIDLYEYIETGPTPNKYQWAGLPTYARDRDTVTVTRTVTDKSLEDVRTIRKQDATAMFRAVADAGTEIDLGAGLMRIETTHAAQQELDKLAERLATSGGTQSAVTRAGTTVTLNLAAATTLSRALANRRAAATTNEFDLYVAIDAAKDVAAVLAVDVEAGWPE